MKAPTFVAIDLTSKQIRLDDYLGKIVLLFFWSVNCGPCKRELPYVQQVAKNRPNDVQIFGISGDPDGEPLRRVIRDQQLSWIHVAENEWFAGPISSKYSVLRYPTIYILDKNGRIAVKHARGQDIEKAILKLL